MEEEAVPEIRRLDETVVNRIAAGEVLHRPANAIKEMIENSVDAGATSIQVMAKDGGLKLLQIVDNGHGIRKEDLPIVCERFTTSKLDKYEDLSSIATFGFRGEALASISHVAHVTIITRTASMPCAYKATYKDGKLSAPRPGDSTDPKPCAGNVGTQITVEDLFYNVATRRKALKSFSDEYGRILDVVGRYAVHYPHISFACKKHGSNTADLATNAGGAVLDGIRVVHGASVARELLEVTATDAKFSLEVHGLISNANYSVKKGAFLLFINHRAVESANLKRAIDVMYANFLPKGTHPFVYLALQLAPSSVDVNVHPTKREVHFLHEEEVIEAVVEAMRSRLMGANTSRTFLTQTLLPGAVPTIASVSTSSSAPQQTVRTDSRSRTLDSFVVPMTRPSSSAGTEDDEEERRPKRNRREIQEEEEEEQEEAEEAEEEEEEQEEQQQEEEDEQEEQEEQEKNSQEEDEQQQPTRSSRRRTPSSPLNSSAPSAPNSSASSTRSASAAASSSVTSSPRRRAASPPPPATKRVRQEVRLTSVAELRAAVDTESHSGLVDILREHAFVGCVDARLALIQHQTRLIVVDYHALSREFFYQQSLREFANFGRIALSHPPPLRALLMAALESPEAAWTPADGTKEALVGAVERLLVDRCAMLNEYFGIEIQQEEHVVEARLVALPLMLSGHMPNLERIPMMLLRLGSEVDWDDEKRCLDGISRELGIAYAAWPTVGAAPDEDAHYRWVVEHVLFPGMRTGFQPPRKCATNGQVLQIASLPELYKIFERC